MNLHMDTTTFFQLAEVGGMLVLATLFVVMIKSDVKVLKVQLDGITDNLRVLNSSFARLSDVLSATAVQDSKISRLEEDIRELRHGRGFVREDSVSGEYNRVGKVK